MGCAKLLTMQAVRSDQYSQDTCGFETFHESDIMSEFGAIGATSLFNNMYIKNADECDIFVSI